MASKKTTFSGLSKYSGQTAKKLRIGYMGDPVYTLVWQENGTTTNGTTLGTYLAGLTPAGSANTLNSQGWTKTQQQGSTTAEMFYNTTYNHWYTKTLNAATQRTASYDISFPSPLSGITHEVTWHVVAGDSGSGAFSNTGQVVSNTAATGYAHWYMYDDNATNDLYFVVDGVTKHSILNINTSTRTMAIKISQDKSITFWQNGVQVGPATTVTWNIDKCRIYGYTETGTPAWVSGNSVQGVQTGWSNERIYTWVS